VVEKATFWAARINYPVPSGIHK